MTNPFDLTGKVAVVTGANTGIGQGIALALAAAGADIAAVGRSAATETVEKARALGVQAEIISADLSTIEPVGRVVDEAVEKLGGLDILVNNAGIIRRNDSLDFTEEDWDAVIDTNLKSLFFLSQAAGRHMIAKGRGKIINIASMLSFQGGIRVPSYTASKSGVAGLTRLLACEWAANRKAFGKTIGEFQGVGFKVANMAVDIKLGDLMVKEAAWKMDNGQMDRTAASVCPARESATANSTWARS